MTMFEVERKEGVYEYRHIAYFTNKEDAEQCVKVLLDMDKNVDNKFVDMNGMYPSYKIIDLTGVGVSFKDWLREKVIWDSLEQREWCRKTLPKLFAFKEKYIEILNKMEE